MTLVEAKAAIGSEWADYVIEDNGEFVVSFRNTNAYAPFFGFSAVSKEVITYSLHDGETGAKIWDVFKEPGPSENAGGIKAPYNATLLPGGILSLATPYSHIDWMTVRKGGSVHAQK